MRGKEPRGPVDWFRDLGYDLNVASDADGVWWATLTAIDHPDFVVHRYGRGATQCDAAERARHRWRVEQIGIDRESG